VLTVEQIYRLRKTFALLEGQAHVAALVFYQRLFELDPALRPLFKNDIEVQAGKLMDMLSASLSLMERPAELAGILENLGASHVTYGVKTSDYETVGKALLTMLEAVLGKQFTDEVRLSWTSLYQLISATMLRGAARVVR
jgi:hemoglobin-like flavoprotein